MQVRWGAPTGFSIEVNSTFVKTTSLLHIANIFSYKFLSDVPTTLFSKPLSRHTEANINFLEMHTMLLAI